MPFSEPVMMRVSSKHSRVQRVITGVCRMARSLCADGRMQGRRSAGAAGMGRARQAQRGGRGWRGLARGGRGRQRIAIREWQGVAGGGRGVAGLAYTSVGRSQIHYHLPLTTYDFPLATYDLRLTYYSLLTVHCWLPTSVRRSHILTRESKPLETTCGRGGA